MPRVFVHGNPETSAIWGPLIDALAEHGVDDVITLTPPGFGAPVEPDFDATPAGYVAWLAGELRQFDGPIDLVGHDWGAGHVFGLLASEPGLVRSFAADCGGLLNPDYEWHEAAQGWQTPGVGEESVQGMVAVPTPDLAAVYEGLGMSAEIALTVAEAVDETMAACILSLYRGAKQPKLQELGEQLAAADLPPGLILDATDDPYVGSDLVPAVVEALGTEHVRLEGQGHWWMISDPAPAAQALADFWGSLS